MITGSKVKLRDKRLADALNDYAWQTDPELSELDAVSSLTTGFSEYLSAYDSELRYPLLTRQRFAVETLDGKHIGNCAFYNIDEKKGEAELGIMIGNHDYWDKGYGTDAVMALLSYVSWRTKLRRVYLKTLVSNLRAQKCFQKCGFTAYGRMVRDGYSFVVMEFRLKQHEEAARTKLNMKEERYQLNKGT